MTHAGRRDAGSPLRSSQCRKTSAPRLSHSAAGRAVINARSAAQLPLSGRASNADQSSVPSGTRSRVAPWGSRRRATARTSGGRPGRAATQRANTWALSRQSWAGSLWAACSRYSLSSACDGSPGKTRLASSSVSTTRVSRSGGNVVPIRPSRRGRSKRRTL